MFPVNMREEVRLQIADGQLELAQCTLDHIQNHPANEPFDMKQVLAELETYIYKARHALGVL